MMVFTFLTLYIPSWQLHHVLPQEGEDLKMESSFQLRHLVENKMFKKQKLIFIFQGLADFLDNYRMSTSLLQTLNMTRYPINPVL